ncbi:hypothetical protein [Cellulomonas sp. PS-H5]|uniref:hypothetical protein n=1 Tax=Cellulomonas sp. PS-H5 TaxID=2820400 RepID=UPI001C4F7A92|nr:hypothetical protein [Cellulomonas sp. PS-H5]MBW0254966.1 hypothetical protein [Cellulomonas sp. PS-H5]
MDLAIGLGGALLGGAIAVGGSISVTTMNLHADREREARDLRRPVYTAYRDAANEFATGMAQRFTCEISDPPIEPCAISRDEVQTLRYNLQRATNAVHIVGTDEAVSAMFDVANAMPPTLVGLTGEPEIGFVDERWFERAIREFDRVTNCETSPDPSGDFC